MKILETVIGSNQRLIQAHTVEKNAGAPMMKIPGHVLSVQSCGDDGCLLTIESLWIMGRCELTSSLHVSLQVPKLLQADPRDINDVGAQGDGSVAVLAVSKLRRQRLGEASEVLVQRKQAHHARGRLAVELGFAKGRFLAQLLISSDCLAVELLDLEQVDGNAATVAAAKPLRVQATGLLKGIELDGLVEDVNVVGGAPGFRVLELRESVFGDPSSCAKVSAA